MSLQVKVGSFATETATGNKAYTGVGFQPKAIIFIFENGTADGSANSFVRGYGFGIDATHRVAVCAAGVDNVASGTAHMSRAHSETAVIYTATGAASPVTLVIADLVSMDADGFTLNYSNIEATGYIVNYIALGGTDLTNAFIKAATVPAATGSVAYTGVGFQPDALFTIGIGSTTATPAIDSNAGSRIGMGFGITGGVAKISAQQTTDASPNTKSSGAQKSSIFAQVNANGDTMRNEATLTSLDSDGFTWNWTSRADLSKFWVLCVKGGQWKTGVFNQAVTPNTGNQAVTGIGFQPTGLILTSWNKATSTSVLSNGYQSFGAGVSSTERFCVWLGDRDDVATSVTDNDIDRTKIMKTLTEGTPTLTTSADLVSLDSDGFTITNGTVDATAREIVYMAFGSNAGAATSVKDIIDQNGIIPFAR